MAAVANHHSCARPEARPQRELTQDGLVYRYATDACDGAVDALPGKEGGFLPCSFWLAWALAMPGRQPEARVLFDRLGSRARAARP